MPGHASVITEFQQSPGKRILVAGTSGAGKSTLATRLSELLSLPYVELDSLFHGPGWTRRPQFTADVDRFTSQPAWVCEWQYRQVKPLLLQRADTLLWLDYSRAVVMTRVALRTLKRKVLGLELWNGNREPSLLHAFTDREGIVRWAWDTYSRNRQEILELGKSPSDPQVIRLGTPAETSRWLANLERSIPVRPAISPEP